MDVESRGGTWVKRRRCGSLASIDATSCGAASGNKIVCANVCGAHAHGWGAGKDPVAGPEDLKMIHGGKVLDNTKTFEGRMPALQP